MIDSAGVSSIAGGKKYPRAIENFANRAAGSL
eukprot:CAMPEP_0174874924 /NCGR_PEP_ID=MMETSP1114-20130205/77534_1 /TAXON_ID=312471 /ORGANISM="Neobodo designis, Strain CCAP 1951/1" /LENGTH=31 /DNA_ID= /DNA_START= /DNA_END= /DNA_ORIENTATION=